MNRPRRAGLLFAFFLVIAFAAMAWVSVKALELERSEREMREQAIVEENVRLALWRMDSALAPVIAAESARPQSAFTNMDGAQLAAAAQEPEKFALTDFKLAPGESIGPEVPNLSDPKQIAMVENVGNDTIVENMAAQEMKMPDIESFNAVDITKEPAQVRQSKDYWARPTQIIRNADELRNRDINAQVSYANLGANPSLSYSDASRTKILQPIWIKGTLFLARKTGNGAVEGVVMDWPKMEKWLLGQIADLLPDASIVPLKPGETDEGGRMLATIPARLVPGDLPVEDSGPLSIRFALYMAWAFALVAALAVAALFAGALSLSERRAAFVSAVTHELRTPLTTFRMYAEMLASGMVSDEEKREKYLATLQAEAERLSHLVENVLSYARLEKGNSLGELQEIRIEDLLARVERPLAERATSAGMELTIQAEESALSARVKADPAGVERVLYNLVDNACKYAANSADKAIDLSAKVEGGHLLLRVCDHGPGLSAQASRRLFSPFSKSAAQAAESAPGVGLGLALSRRIARRMKGDLKLDFSHPSGACFVLSLPLC